MTAQTNPPPQWHIGPALAGWLVPGLGHFLVGERVRGAILCVAILGLWLGGLLIGGVSVIDRSQHWAWFLGQMCLAPSVAINHSHDYINPGRIPPKPPGPAVAAPPFVPSYGRPNEQGILYTALAGLLNLLAIIDVLYYDPARRHDAGAKAGPAAGPAAGAQIGDPKAPNPQP